MPDRRVKPRSPLLWRRCGIGLLLVGSTVALGRLVGAYVVAVATLDDLQGAPSVPTVHLGQLQVARSTKRYVHHRQKWQTDYSHHQAAVNNTWQVAVAKHHSSTVATSRTGASHTTPTAPA